MKKIIGIVLSIVVAAIFIIGHVYIFDLIFGGTSIHPSGKIAEPMNWDWIGGKVELQCLFWLTICIDLVLLGWFFELEYK